MDLINTTDVNAAFINTVVSDDGMLGAVIARPTFRIEGEELVHDPDEAWPIDMAPQVTPYGELPGDVPFLTGGVDVLVMGDACQPDGVPRPHVRIEIGVGERFRRWIDVFGDRYWVRPYQGADLVATEPEPFVSMPLTYENAYGGKVQLEEGELSCAGNPHGKGFYFTEEQAENGPLPNVEDPYNHIRHFSDQPDPVGTAPYPKDGSLKPLAAAKLKADNSALERITPVMFSAAHPEMIIPAGEAPKPGDVVEAINVGPGGGVRFRLPDLPLHVHVQLEDRSWVFPLHMDRIAVVATEGLVILSYRVAFKYRIVEMERRVVTLRPGPVPARVPPEYVQVWRD